MYFYISKKMNEKPLFTIGIASYNYANYIKKLLSSIKEQTFKDYEILISDDFSTDNSLQVINEFIEENPDLCVRVIVAEKNEGLVANKNKLIKNCNGKYLMLCDADDWMSKDCLSEIAKKIAEENEDGEEAAKIQVIRLSSLIRWICFKIGRASCRERVFVPV